MHTSSWVKQLERQQDSCPLPSMHLKDSKDAKHNSWLHWRFFFLPWNCMKPVFWQLKLQKCERFSAQLGLSSFFSVFFLYRHFSSTCTLRKNIKISLPLIKSCAKNVVLSLWNLMQFSSLHISAYLGWQRMLIFIIGFYQKRKKECPALNSLSLSAPQEDSTETKPKSQSVSTMWPPHGLGTVKSKCIPRAQHSQVQQG